MWYDFRRGGMSWTTRLGQVCFISVRKPFILQDLALGCGILILGMAFCMCRKTVKTFPMGRDRATLRIPWLCKNCPHADTSGTLSVLFLLILKKRVRYRRNFPSKKWRTPQGGAWETIVERARSIGLMSLNICITKVFRLPDLYVHGGFIGLMSVNKKWCLPPQQQ